jgi:hypothetical protein
MRILHYLFLFFLASAVTAVAQDTSKKYGDIKFSGVLYSFYYDNLTNTQPASNSFPQEAGEPKALGYNQFDIERIYLNVQSQLSSNTAFKVTTDVWRNAAYPGTSASTTLPVFDSTGKKTNETVIVPGTASSSYYNGLTIRLKFGYFDWNPAQDLTLRFGMQPTPWIGLMDGVWGYRGVQQTAIDKNKFMIASDLGFSAGWNFPNKYGNLTAYIFNGQGYVNPEFDRFKDVAAKIEINPFPTDNVLKGLKIAGYGYWGSRLLSSTIQSSNALAYNTMGGMVWFNNDAYNVGVEYDLHQVGQSVAGTGAQAGQMLVADSNVTSTVLSIFGNVKGPGEMKDWAVFARVDLFNPITATLPSTVIYTPANTTNTFIVAGISYQASKGVQLALDYQGTTFAHNVLTPFNATGAPASNESGVSASDARLFLHGIVSF